MNNLVDWTLGFKPCIDEQLFEAVRASDFHGISRLLQQGATLKCLEKQGGVWISPLNQAILMNNLTLVKFLVTHGAAVNAERKDWKVSSFLTVLDVLPALIFFKLMFEIIQYNNDKALNSLTILGAILLPREFFRPAIKEVKDAVDMAPSPLYVARAHGFLKIEHFLNNNGAQLKPQEAKQESLKERIYLGSAGVKA